MSPKGRVAVALSGGVDSSMVAVMLKEAGYEIIGISMHLWCEEKSETANQCRPRRSVANIRDAEQLCASLGVPFYLLNFETEFQQHVVRRFYQEYQQGRTPNPCITCNQYIKFHFLLDRALALGADYLATGHYARIAWYHNSYHLLKGIDRGKDQSYFLYTLKQEQLKHLLFPIGTYRKEEIRRLARDKGLPVVERKDSQDLCFVHNDYRSLLDHFQRPTPGKVIGTDGKILGEHKGLTYYTIGQRYVPKISSGYRLYVLKMNPRLNQIVVGREEELYTQKLIAREVNWVSGKAPTEPITVTAKIRYKSPEVSAGIFPKRDFVEVVFSQPQRAVTCGQAVVFYKGEEVLGGGTIEEPEAISEQEQAHASATKL